MPKGQVCRVAGASFSSCEKNTNPWPLILLSPCSRCLKPLCSRNGPILLAAGVLDSVPRRCAQGPSAPLETRPQGHTKSMGFIYNKGTSSPFSRKVTSSALAFGHSRTVFITLKPDSSPLPGDVAFRSAPGTRASTIHTCVVQNTAARSNE